VRRPDPRARRDLGTTTIEVREMRRGRGRQWLADDQGAIAVIMGVSLLVVLGFTVMAIDVGALFEERRTLQTAADAAALAGVQELPVSPAQAEALAGEYTDTNLVVDTDKEVVISSTFGPNDTISVHIVNPETELFFASVFGFDSAPVPADAAAVVGSPSSIIGRRVMPFGVMSRDPSSSVEPFGYSFGELVRLKQPPSAAEHGNFHFLDVAGDPLEHGGDANEIKDALENGGVPNIVYMDYYFTETGLNGSNILKSLLAKPPFPQGRGDGWIFCNHAFGEAVGTPDEDGFVEFFDLSENPPPDAPAGWDGRCHRIILCPIIINPEYDHPDPRRYNWTELQGQSGPPLIIGFAYFFVTDWGTQGNDMWIEGRFIRPSVDDADQIGQITPWGSILYRLID
jgi:hypothetical protein